MPGVLIMRVPPSASHLAPSRALLGALCVALSACGADAPPRVRVLEDYLVTSTAHPFSIRYLGHCGGSVRDSVEPAAFRASAGRLVFQATTDGDDAGLWSSDGTSAGTRLVTSSSAYSEGAETPYVADILPLGEGMYFAMRGACAFPTPPAVHVTPLYWIDANGPPQLRLGAHDVRHLALSGERLFFDATASDGRTGIFTLASGAREPTELWRFDGISGLVTTSAGAFFGARIGSSEGLWFSDGSVAGTQPLTYACAPDFANRRVVSVGRRAYFACGRQLWMSDGGAATTLAVPGAPVDVTGLYATLVPWNASLAFFYRPASAERAVELWLTDGAAAGTRRLGAFTLDAHKQPGTPALATRDSLDFTVDDALWRSDGSASGTRAVASLPPRTPQSFAFPGGRFLATLGDALIIVMNDAEVWRYDGRAAERVPVAASVSFIDELTATSGQVFYAARGDEPLLSLRGLHFLER